MKKEISAHLFSSKAVAIRNDICTNNIKSMYAESGNRPPHKAIRNKPTDVYESQSKNAAYITIPIMVVTNSQIENISSKTLGLTSPSILHKCSSLTILRVLESKDSNLSPPSNSGAIRKKDKASKMFDSTSGFASAAATCCHQPPKAASCYPCLQRWTVLRFRAATHLGRGRNRLGTFPYQRMIGRVTARIARMRGGTPSHPSGDFEYKTLSPLRQRADDP